MEDHMPSNIQDQMHELEELRLAELQARFAEIVGEPTRTPNKQYLLRRSAESLEANRPAMAAGMLSTRASTSPTTTSPRSLNPPMLTVRSTTRVNPRPPRTSPTSS